MDHLEEAKGTIGLRGQARWSDSTVEAEGCDFLGEGQLAFRRIAKARELTKNLLISFGVQVSPEV